MISRSFFTDTPRETEDLFFQRLRELPSWRKFDMLDQLHSTARKLALLGLQRRYPHASPQKLKRRMADLVLGADLAARVYGPDDPRG